MVMKVKMQVRRMWDAVRYSDADFDEDQRALEALLAAVPTEMHSSLANKRTTKDAWDAIAAARIGNDRARRSTLQKLRKEWENLAFKPGEDVDNFALRLNTLMQQLARYVDNDIDEERAVEKFLHVVPKKNSQVAIAIEMLLDFSELSIEEVTGRLKAVDNHEQLPPSEPITIDGKLLFTEEQWLARQRERKKGEASGSSASGSSSSRKRQRASGIRRVVVLLTAPTASARLPAMTPARTVGGPATGPRTAGRRSAAVRHTSCKRRRVTSQLCSSYTGASSRTPLPRRPPLRSSTSTSHGPTSSSATGLAATRSTGGTSTLAPPTT
jgi:hypothetical protein